MIKWSTFRAESGHIVTVKELAEIIDENSWCRNVNFVGGEPTPHLPFILDCLHRPVWKAYLYPEISRGLTDMECKKAVNYAKDMGLNFIT